MNFFDSHAHIDDKIFNKDIKEVIARADEAGVASVMIVGTDVKSSERAVSLAESIDGYYASVGVHPHDAKMCSESDIDFLLNLAKSPFVRAWGETGLDFNRMFSPAKEQEKWFIRQLAAADQSKLPLIFHERESNGRFLEILKSSFNRDLQGVVHCFSGNKEELKAYLDLGLFIGITGIITIKKRGEYLRELAGYIPVDRILVETDAPYLTPAPEKNRTRRNEPAFVKSVLLKVADVRGDDPGELSEIVWENTCRLYRI